MFNKSAPTNCTSVWSEQRDYRSGRLVYNCSSVVVSPQSKSSSSQLINAQHQSQRSHSKLSTSSTEEASTSLANDSSVSHTSSASPAPGQLFSRVPVSVANKRRGRQVERERSGLNPSVPKSLLRRFSEQTSNTSGTIIDYLTTNSLVSLLSSSGGAKSPSCASLSSASFGSSNSSGSTSSSSSSGGARSCSISTNSFGRRNRRATTTRVYGHQRQAKPSSPASIASQLSARVTGPRQSQPNGRNPNNPRGDQNLRQRLAAAAATTAARISAPNVSKSQHHRARDEASIVFALKQELAKWMKVFNH